MTTITPRVVGVLAVIKNGSVMVSFIPILFFIFVQYDYINFNIIRDIEPIIVKMRLLE